MVWRINKSSSTPSTPISAPPIPSIKEAVKRPIPKVQQRVEREEITEEEEDNQEQEFYDEPVKKQQSFVNWQVKYVKIETMKPILYNAETKERIELTDNLLAEVICNIFNNKGD